MARPRRNDAQDQACKAINEALDELREIRSILDDKDFVFCFTHGKRKLTIDTALRAKMDTVLQSQKAKRVKMILTLADKHMIELSDEERELLC